MWLMLSNGARMGPLTSWITFEDGVSPEKIYRVNQYVQPAASRS